MRVLVGVSIVVGLSGGVYETALPLFLESAGISLKNIGMIYALPALLGIVLSLSAGSWSDRVGRKLVFVINLFAQGVATLATPLGVGRVYQIAVKCVRDPCFRLHELLVSVLVHDQSRSRFLRFFGRLRGAEFTFSFIGLLVTAGFLWLCTASGAGRPVEWVLMAVGVVLLANTVFFGMAYREAGSRRERARTRPRVALRDLLRPHLNRPLRLLMLSALVFNIGLWCSHGFVPPLFFRQKFGVSDEGVFLIMALHRLSLALPMLLTGQIVRRRLKEAFVVFVILEGALIAVPAMIPSFYWATGVWLFHDFFGAGIWWPIQHTLIHRYAGEKYRGRQMGAVLGLSAFGMALGPLLAGRLSALFPDDPGMGVSAPLIVGGLLMIVSAAFLVLLPPSTETAKAASGAASVENG